MPYAIQRINANRVGRLVSMPQWCGGLDREHLAYLMGVKSHNRKQFEIALMVAYKRGLVVFCGNYVCCPAKDQMSV